MAVVKDQLLSVRGPCETIAAEGLAGRRGELAQRSSQGRDQENPVGIEPWSTAYSYVLAIRRVCCPVKTHTGSIVCNLQWLSGPDHLRVQVAPWSVGVVVPYECDLVAVGREAGKPDISGQRSKGHNFKLLKFGQPLHPLDPRR